MLCCAECHRPIEGLTFVPRTPKVCDACYVARTPLEASQCPHRRRQKGADNERTSQDGASHAIPRDRRDEDGD